MKSKIKTDLPDSANDKKLPGTEPSNTNLSDTSREPANSNIPSTDEKGYTVLDNPDAQDLLADQLNANVTRDERKSLDDAANKTPTPDQEALERAELDRFDEEGEPLNESAGLSGGDLDVPGSELDDDNEEIGEEDEENNSFTLDDETEENDNTRQ